MEPATSSTRLVEPGDAEAPPYDAGVDAGVDAGPRPPVQIVGVTASGGCTDYTLERDLWGGVRTVRFSSYREQISASQFATTASCTLALEVASRENVGYTITPHWSGTASLSQREMRAMTKTKSWWLGAVPNRDVVSTANGPFGGDLSITPSPQVSRCGERHDRHLITQSTIDLRNGSPGGDGEIQVDGVHFTIEVSACPSPTK